MRASLIGDNVFSAELLVLFLIKLLSMTNVQRYNWAFITTELEM